jgi:hypothetical protein
MNLSAVAALPSRPIASVWYRAVRPQHLPDSLNYSHTRLFASRYYEGPTSPILFDTLYLAENPLVAQFEVGALFGSPLVRGRLIPNPADSWLIVNAEVQLTKVADLTDARGSHAPLLTTAQELTGDWEQYSPRTGVIAPTQQLGAALYTSGLVEGFLTISAKLPYQKVLGVFPERITKGNFVRYRYQDSAGQTQILQIPFTTPSPEP